VPWSCRPPRPESHLPAGLIITSPRAEGAGTITIRFDAWKRVGGVNLVSHVTIIHGPERWTFDFKTLVLNSADKSLFRVPRDLRR